MCSRITTQQLVTAVMCTQEDNHLHKHKTTQAYSAARKQQPMLISAHPGFLCLAFTPSFSLSRSLTHPHTHTPIFYPKSHGGKISLILSQPFFPLSSCRHHFLFCPSAASEISLFFWQTLTNSLSQPRSASFPFFLAFSHSSAFFFVLK